jgi:pimeloyl-ACP methyl ester carboxylesterase
MRMIIPLLCVAVLPACTPAAHAPAPASEREVQVPVQGGTVYVRESGAGPAVVLLHGGGLDLTSWDAQVPRLARTFRVIRVDARGHGRSTAPAGPMDPAQDLARVLDQLDVPRASLVGLSMGGGTAFSFALAHPGRVERLVLVSTSGPPPGVPLPPGMLVPSDSAGRAALAGTRVPVLVIAGADDSERVLATAAAIEREVPGARRVVIGGADHAVNSQRVDEFNRVLLEFLAARTH